MNGTMYFWGGARQRDYQCLCPNEAIHWYAMRYWKKRGISRYDMGGGAEYKRKYGGYEIRVPWIRKSKHPLIGHARNIVKQVQMIRQKCRGTLRHMRLDTV